MRNDVYNFKVCHHLQELSEYKDKVKVLLGIQTWLGGGVMF